MDTYGALVRVPKSVLCLLLALTCIEAWGSINRGTIRGTVTDPQGAVVPNASIAVIDVDTGVRQDTRSNGAGFYVVPELVPGPYRVHFEVAGFVPGDVNDVMVKANDVATVDIQLKLGSTAERVEVTATNPLVETTAANFSVPIEQRYMQELPILGRDVQSLVQLIPGVTQSVGPPGTLVGFNGGQFGGFPDPTHIVGSLISANGSQASSNLWYLDGNVNAAAGNDNVVVDPAPDALSEFQAVTNAFAAEYGRTAGGVFNVVLKSGTNSLHGDVYEYNRNSYFEARNPFSGRDPFGNQLPPNYVNWNQFGGTIGGPIMLPHIYDGRNRTFFFAAWDISLLHEKSPGTLFTVPTLLERQGNFSELPGVRSFGIYDPLTTRYSPSLGTFVRQPFLNPDGSLATSLPPNRIDPAAQYFMNSFPAPNFLDPRQQNAAAGGCLNLCNNFQGSFGSGQTTHSAIVKVDHQINEKNKLFVDWLFNPTTYALFKLPWKGATTQLAGFNGSFPWHVGNEIASLGITTTFNPTVVNEFRFIYSRQSTVPLAVPNSLQDTSGTLQHIQGLNIPVFPPLEPSPIFTVGSTSFGPPVNNLEEVTQAATVADNFTKVLSRHTIKTGFMFRSDISGTEFPTESYLIFGGSLVNNPVTGQGGAGGYAQFLLGAVDQGSFVRYIPSTIGSAHTWGFYAQDDYRVTPKFTLNYGLRYDINGWFDDRHNNGSLFDFVRPNPEDPIRIGRIDYFATPAHPDRRIYSPNYADFGPRLNFVYSPFADQKTVIRGGLDLVYTNGTTQPNGQGAGASENPGYNAYISWLQDATGQNLKATYVVPAFILSQGAPTLPPYTNPRPRDAQILGAAYGGLSTEVKNVHRDPNVAFWNFQVQRELPGNMVISAAYVGSKGTDLTGEQNRVYDYVPTAIRLKLRSQLNQLVTMPTDLAPLYGSQYFLSQLYLPYPQYPYVGNIWSVDQSSSYNALQMKLEKRFSHGLNFLVAYTVEKTIGSPGLGGFASQTWAGGPSFGSGRGRIGQVAGGTGTTWMGGVYQDPDNRNLDRTLSPDETPQVLNFAWTYELPFGPGKSLASKVTGVPRHLVAGWKISGNFNAQRGVPMTISGPCNGLTCRPNLVGDPNAGRSSKSRYQQEQQWWNPNAFEAVFGSDPAIIGLATNGTPQQKDQYDQFWRFGTLNVRSGNVRSPNFWNVDMALAKDFKITEAKYFQFRMEAFNALNHQNLGLPNTGWCLPPNPDGSVDAVHQFGCQFGRITGVQTDPRSLEFGLKFFF